MLKTTGDTIPPFFHKNKVLWKRLFKPSNFKTQNMEPNKILVSDLLDLIFDDRNKEYGAYELRKTYQQRIGKSLLFTGIFAGLIFAGAAIAGSLEPERTAQIAIREHTIAAVEEEIKVIKPKQPEVRPVEQQRTQQYIPPTLVDVTDEPPPSQEELAVAHIDTKTQEGVFDKDIPFEPVVGDPRGIIEAKNDEPAGPYTIVEIEAKFHGWEKFLYKHLNPQVPADNGAPAGSYTVSVKFVVDLEGNVSQVTPLTNHGFGMENEALRVLKKATKWEPAVQNGYKVPAYRIQKITFIVLGDE
jgi:protein TonB